MSNNKRVVITGMGVVSPVGIGVKDFWSSLKEGKSGVGLISHFDTSEYTTKIAAEVKDFDPKEYLDRKDARRMDRFTQFALVAAKEAVKDAELNSEGEEERVGVSLGCGVGGITTLENEFQKLKDRGPNRVSPLFVPMMISNIAAGQVSIAFDAKGPCVTAVSACASATNAIGDAFKIIQRGDADVMIAGGAEAPITPLAVAGFCSMKAMSTRNDDPQRASRPFDEGRDGFVMGEGAGVLILEELEHAKKRGAKIYGEMVGYGMSADAYHITAPAEGGEGAARSMKNAINDAGVDPSVIDYINAHGTSTPYNDKFETMAIKSVFKDHSKNLCVSSTKSMTGHLLGAAGAIEAIVSVMSTKEDFVHCTKNIENQDPELDLDYVPNEGRSVKVDYALSNSLGFGGHNATIIFKKYI